MQEIGFGGSCHWCTEAIFQSLKGVTNVQQGWITNPNEPERYSEAVLVRFNPQMIPLETLIEVHLYTHSCTSVHSMRGKYRSAIYCFSAAQITTAVEAIATLQCNFTEPIITEILSFGTFRLNQPRYLNYYHSDPGKPFCKNIVEPKLKSLLHRFSGILEAGKLAHLSAATQDT